MIKEVKYIFVKWFHTGIYIHPWHHSSPGHPDKNHKTNLRINRLSGKNNITEFFSVYCLKRYCFLLNILIP